MSYTVGGTPMSLREVLMEMSLCWCEKPSLLTDLEGGGNGCVQPVASSQDVVSQDGYLWYTVVFPRLPLWQVVGVVDSLAALLPSDVWHYGAREDHQEEPLCRNSACRRVHSCVVVLLGCGKPCLPRVIEEIASNVMRETLGHDDEPVAVSVTPCPPHANDGDVHFALVRDWVLARVDFISAAGRGTSLTGLKRGVFGFAGILSVMQFQFGTACRPLVVEISLAKQMRDEEDGLLPGGFAPSLVGPEGTREVIYVEPL